MSRWPLLGEAGQGGNGVARTLETKLRGFSPSPEMITRPRLTARLLGSNASLVLFAAPPGFGKTTLLAQWVERASPRAAWVSLDARDNDPTALLAAVARALGRVDPLPDAVAEAMAEQRPAHTVLARLLAWIESDRDPFTLAVDHAEAVTNPEAFDVVTQIALQLPAQHRLLVASRTQPRWPARGCAPTGGCTSCWRRCAKTRWTIAARRSWRRCSKPTPGLAGCISNTSTRTGD